uniref:UDP-glucose ceramide glucosyltransferase-like 1 n=1 Tax=Varanus komodoensis TaxID=61221 RepID=A0A8D2L7X9_VARKO
SFSCTPLLTCSFPFAFPSAQHLFLFFTSDHSYYNLILKKAGQFLTNMQINLLKFSLSLRAYSPTVQMFQQIAADEPSPKGCSAFVVIHGKSTCKADEIKKLLKKAAERPKPYLFKGDHKFPTLNETVPVVILYAEMGTKDFATFHEVLSEKARKEEIVYILRHFVQKPISKKMYLSGYGVELAIKSTEYKAVDDFQAEGTFFSCVNTTEEDVDEESEVQGFLFDTLKQNYPDLRDNLTELRKYLIESSDDTEPLKVWELQDLSFQAASRILSVPVYSAVKVMKDIAQNFPVKARYEDATELWCTHHLHKTLELQPGEARLFLNGLPIDLEFHDPFSILDTLRLEGKAMHGLHSLGIKEDVLSKFMRLAVHSEDEAYALDIRHSSIVWINNIEKDQMYDKWPSSFQELLKPAYAGMMRQIRRNLYNLVLFIDPTQEEAVHFIKLVEVIYSQKVPIRIGFVFVVNTDEVVDGNQDAGVALWRAFNFVAEEMDIPEAFGSIIHMYREVKDGGVLSVSHVKRVLRSAFPHADMQDILGIHSYYDERRKAGAAFYKKTRLGPLPQALFNGVPFNKKEMNIGELGTSLLKIMEATESFQRAVFMGLLNDHKDAVDFIMEQQNVVSHIHDKILDTERRYLNFASPSVILFTCLIYTPANMCYLLVFSDDNVIYPVTIWIVADFDKPDGRQLLSNALKHLKTSSHIQLGVVHNPAAKITEDGTVMARAISAAFLTQKNASLKTFLAHILKEEIAQSLATGTKIKKFLLPGMNGDAFEKKYNTMGTELIKVHQMFCQEVLKLLPGQMATVSNGRVSKETGLCLPSPSVLELIRPDRAGGSNLVMKVNALLSSLPKMDTRHDIEFLDDQHRVRLFMNCRSKLSELPLKSFYRFVLEPELTIGTNNIFPYPPGATFFEMPESPLLTLNMITPESWLVEAVNSSYDLDNIHLKEVDGVVSAEYELEYLLLEGRCFDVSNRQPTYGLQFTLGTRNNPVKVDTIVMANLGYFQLKANPGAWILRLREGRSEEIYEIFKHEGTDSSGVSEEVIVVLNSFKSKIIEVQVCMIINLYQNDCCSPPFPLFLFSEVKDHFSGATQTTEKGKKMDILNIFSVASGHLYERFLRIMMLSVLRHTKTPVKFWFLKNYLSPTFKEVIPQMAEEYGFQYELVQYKWPQWLHQQTEKQRIIWGYKILFLDVLFPLAVDKIIFVDADQIVRSDLKELRDTDLKGAPYGYTPFCDSRKEMDGYRFWKSGYWASHLGKRKYHISALYVVDLKRFRKIAAGDRLRGQYQALSKDPNSLSNLDQDLPNNMIHQVAIKSLPQEWLWCETWCSDESKHKAKTIDLCNNPKTKEPKLEAAIRIVPEWTEYDSEIQKLINRIRKKRKNAGRSHKNGETREHRQYYRISQRFAGGGGSRG